MKKIIAAILCIAMCICIVSVPMTADDTAARDVTLEESYASALKSLGLFRGVSETNFDLKRAPTRVEALVMLIRVLGEENAALEGDWEHPFTDVAKWADPYVGYAYETGLTKGVSATEFGNGDSTAAMYLTFMLRALGYSDVNNEDFSWNDPYSLARTAGILSDEVNIEIFWRADAVTVSFAALSAYLKNSSVTLASKLIDANVFTEEQYEAAMYSVTPTPNPDTDSVLTAIQISEKCAPAVFYVEIYAYNGNLVGSGSGFFISADGYAITNYHVAANSLKLVITTESGKKYEDVRIVDASLENDLALLKVNSNDTFKYLEFGNSDAIKQGQNVYAIGSPRGLENTLSQGIISNVNRPIDGTPYMQISVPIDRGSSGGALIDEYGKVIAVTTAGITDNTADLNLAVPIKYAKELDKSRNEELELWNEIFYQGFDGVYDFGAFTGMKSTQVEVASLGIVAVYETSDISDNDKYTKEQIIERCLDLYTKALKANGFVLKQYDEKTSLSVYEKGEVRVNIAVNSDTKQIGVAVERIAQYYREVPSVIDAGWYFGIPDGKYDYVNGAHLYEYNWSKYYGGEEFVESFVVYAVCLTVEGFEYTGAEENLGREGKFEFSGNGYDITLYLTNTHLSVEITTSKPDTGTTTNPTTPTDPESKREPQTSAYYTLRDYLISNAAYFQEYGEYITGTQLGDVSYFICYSPEYEEIYFSCEMPNSVLNISLLSNGENYLYYYAQNGANIIEYLAEIYRAEFSRNATLTTINFSGSASEEKIYHDTVLANAISMLEFCEQTCLQPYVGITLADLGFTSIYN